MKVILVLLVSNEDTIWYAVDQIHKNEMEDEMAWALEYGCPVPCGWTEFQNWLAEHNAEMCDIMSTIAY